MDMYFILLYVYCRFCRWCHVFAWRSRVGDAIARIYKPRAYAESESPEGSNGAKSDVHNCPVTLAVSMKTRQAVKHRFRVFRPFVRLSHPFVLTLTWRVYLNQLTRGQYRRGTHIRYDLKYEGRHSWFTSRSWECDKYVCMFVCLSVHSLDSKTGRPNFTKSFAHVAYCHGFVLLWRRYNTRCTSGFLDAFTYWPRGASCVFLSDDRIYDVHSRHSNRISLSDG